MLVEVVELEMILEVYPLVVQAEVVLVVTAQLVLVMERLTLVVVEVELTNNKKVAELVDLV